MNPSVRLLQVMEYLMAKGSTPVKQIEIARALDLSPATLNRIINTLSERGYILRTSEKYCVRNFRLIRNVPMSESYLAVLDELMKDLTRTHNVAVEVVVVSGFDLLWHSSTQLPNANVAIRAGMGFRRNLYELDALARLYLSRVDWEEINYKFYSGGFFQTGVNMSSISAESAKQIIENAKKSDFACDIDGNHVGVRRFATIIEDEQSNFLHLLSLAEAAVPVPNREEKITETKLILSNAKALLQSHIKKEATSGDHPLKHEISPPHIG